MWSYRFRTNQIAICISYSHTLIDRNKTTLCCHINLQQNQRKYEISSLGLTSLQSQPHQLLRSHTLSKPRPCVNGALPVAINAASTCRKVNQQFVADAAMQLNMQQKD